MYRGWGWQADQFDKWLDSYRHYRTHVGVGRVGAFYRASFYEVMHREPRKYTP